MGGSHDTWTDANDLNSALEFVNNNAQYTNGPLPEPRDFRIEYIDPDNNALFRSERTLQEATLSTIVSPEIAQELQQDQPDWNPANPLDDWELDDANIRR